MPILAGIGILTGLGIIGFIVKEVNKETTSSFTDDIKDTTTNVRNLAILGLLVYGIYVYTKMKKS